MYQNKRIRRLILIVHLMVRKNMVIRNVWQQNSQCFFGVFFSGSCFGFAGNKLVVGK